MNARSYCRRLARHKDSADVIETALFESFNEADWDEFLFDLVREDPLIFEVLRPNKGTDLVGFAFSIFRRLAPVQQRHIAASAIRLARTEASSGSGVEQPVISYMTLLRGLIPEAWVNSAILLYNQKGFPTAARIEILRSCAPHYKNKAVVQFWESILPSARDFPQAFAIVARVLADINPPLAIEFITTAPDAVSPLALATPLRAAFMGVCALDNWRDYLRPFLSNTPPRLSHIVEDILTLPTISAKAKELNSSEQWSAFCEYFSKEKKKVSFAYFGYYSGFESSKSVLPSCLESYIAAYTRAIERTTKTELRYEDNAFSETNEIVDEALNWRLLLAEPMHLTPIRARDAEIVQVGVSKCCALVLSRAVREWFSGRYPAPVFKAGTSFNPRTTTQAGRKALDYGLESLSSVYSHLGLHEKISILAPPNTTNTGVLSDIFRQYAKQLPRGTEPFLSAHVGLMSKYLQSPPRKDGRPEYAALLDWGYGIDLVGKHPAELDLYAVAYDTPIPVGFIYPKGDAAWRSILLQIVGESILSKDDLIAELELLLESQLISLHLDKELDSAPHRLAV